MAGLTATIRHSLVGFLLAGLGALESLGIADRALARQSGYEPAMASAAVVLLERCGEAGCRADISLAGHPMPVLRRARSTSLVGRPGPLLGVGAAIEERHVASVELGTGEVLVLYTDGLTDTPRPRLTDDALLRAIEAVPSQEPQAIASWLIGSTTGPASTRDDTAVVVLRAR